MNTIIIRLLISLFFIGITFYSTKAQVVGIGPLPGTSTSCTRPPDPIISSISNSFACPGDTLSINGQNLGLTSEVFFGAIKAVLLSTSSTVLRVIVPNNANGGKIDIIYGGLQPNPPFGFLSCFYKASTSLSISGTPPILNSASPLSRCTGQSISINGNNLLNVRKVTLGGIDAIFTVVSNTLINVVVPSNAISGSIAVTNGCGTSTLNGFVFLGSNALDIRSVTPAQVCKGEAITVIGANLSSVTTVSVDGISTEFSKIDGTLKVKVPENATSGILTISNQCSTVSYSNSVIDNTAPSRPIIDFGLNLCPGNNFIINDVENSLAEVFLRQFGTSITTKAEIISRDGNIANILIPNNLPSGTYVVQVSDNCGNLSGSSINSININSSPIIEGIDFTNRCVGETLTINGTNFQGVTNVSLGGVSVSYKVVNNNSISVTVPSTAKSGEVVVTNPCGSSKIAGFIFGGTAPVIVSLSKTSACPGETILIRGTNLGGANVSIGQAPATVLSNTGTEINVVVPSPIDPNNLLQVIATCGSDTEPFTVKGGPVINFITPAFQCANNTISISGSNFDGTSKVTIGGVSVPFSVNIGGAVIIANITPEVKSGDVVVTGNCGNATFPGFRMILPPTITGFTPASACVGASISISGTNFEEGEGLQVKVGGAIANYTRNSSTSLSVTVPSGAVSGNIEVTTFVYISPNSCGGTASRAGFTLLKKPRIETIDPLSTCVGQRITISGSEFSGVTSVSIGGVNTTFDLVNNSLQVTAPERVSSGKIVVGNVCGSDERDGFTLLSAPFLEGFSPQSACANQDLILSGNHLGNVTSIEIAGKTVNFKVLSGNSVSINVPPGTNSGDIRVTNVCGSTSIGGFFFLGGPPQIESLSKGSACSGETLVIRGVNLGGATVRIWNVPAQVISNTDTELTVVVPLVQDPGELVLSVTTACGSDKKPFEVKGRLPAISGASNLSRCAGQELTISGSNFNGAIKVTLGGVGVDYKVVNDNSITVTVSREARSGEIGVTNGCGTATLGGFILTGIPPVIESLSSSSACSGEKIVVRGQHLGGATVRIWNVPAQVISNTGTEITVVVPLVEDAGELVLLVTTACGSDKKPFEVKGRLPVISGVNNLSRCAGQELTISGSNFNGVSEVTLGGVGVDYRVVNDNSITVTVSREVRSGEIGVTNGCGTATLGGFILTGIPPVIESLSSSSACSGERIVVRGLHLGGATVRIWNVPAQVVSNTGTEITVVVPLVEDAGELVLSVTTACGSDKKPFEVKGRLPVISGVNNLSRCAGQELTISGSNFNGVSEVTLGGVGVDYRVVNGNSIVVTVSAAARSGEIGVTNGCGTTILRGFVFSGIPPVIQSLSKSSACSGETIVVRGLHLGGATVRIWNVPAQVVSNTGTEITVVVPLVEDAGELVLLVTTACGSDKKPFEVKGRLPVISGVNNLSRCAGQELTISGSNFNGVSEVTLGGVGVDYRVVNGNSIVVIVSAAARSGEIGVTNGCGTTILRGFVFSGIPPVIQSLSKSSACSGETIVVRGLHLGGATVRIWNVPAQVVSNTGTEITVIVPLVEDAGELVLLVTTACGSDKKPFEVKGRLPVISGANPLSACAGAVLTISGNHLSSVYKVTLGGVNVPFNIINNSTLTVKVPVDAQTGDIEVENNCGTAALKGFVLIGDAPVINDFFPKNGCGGEEIIITGKNFGGPPSNPAIWTHPLNPSVHDTVTIYFDASKGSGGLANCNCTVYLHTGLITATSKGPTDWKYVKTQWGVNNPKWAMTRVNGRPNLYKFELNSSILSYYGASTSDTILQMAFVLRDADGKREGKDTGGGDLFISVLNDSNQIFSTLNPQLLIGKREVEIIYNSGDTIIAIAPEIQGSGAVEIITNCGTSRHRQEFSRRPFSEKMNAGLDLEICNSISTEIKLNGSLTNTGDLALWRLIPGRGDTASFSSVSDPRAIVSSMRAAPDGYLFLVWSNEKGCFRSELDRRDTLGIRLFSPPSPAKILVPSSPALCNATVTELKAQPVVTGTGAWQVITGPGRIDVNNQPETRVEGLIPGQNTRIRWKVEHGVCPSVIDEINLINSIANPPAEAGQDRTVCSSLPSLRLDATVRGGQVGRWSLLPGFGTATFRNANDPKTEIFQMVPNENGELILKWEVFGSGCFLKPNDNVDFVRINFDFPPQATILSKDTVLCQGTDYELKASSNFIGFGKWTILSDNGKIQNQNNSQTTITGLSPGKISVTWSVKSGECPEVKDTLNIQVDERPVAFAGSPQMFCAQSEARLNAQVPLVGTGKWEVKPLSVGLENSSSPDTRIFNLPDSGKIELVWIVQNGVCPEARSETYLLNYLEPSAADAGEDAVYCENNPVQLAAVKPKIGIGRWSVISGSASVVNETEASASVNGLIGGSTGIFRWTVSNGVCPEKIDEVNIKVDQLPSLAIAGRDTALCGQDTFRLEALAPSVGEGSWRILNGNIKLDDSKLPNTRLTGLKEGTSAKMIWEVRNGVCPVSSDSIEITGLNIGPEVSPGFLIRDTFCVSDSVKVIEISGSGDDQFAQNASFRWDFGDGNFSLARDPVHRYRNPGSYRVQLKVNKGFCRSFEITKSVFVKPAPCSTPGDFVNRGTPTANPFISLSSFPNPTSGAFRVEAVLNRSLTVIIRVISPEGRLLEMREKSGTTLLTEDFDLQYSGFFIIEVIADGVSRHFRMIGIQP